MLVAGTFPPGFGNRSQVASKVFPWGGVKCNMSCKQPLPLDIEAILGSEQQRAGDTVRIAKHLHIALIIWNGSNGKREGMFAQHVTAPAVLHPPSYTSQRDK